MTLGIEKVTIRLTNDKEIIIDEIWASSIGLGNIFHDSDEVTVIDLRAVVKDTDEMRDNLAHALDIEDSSGIWEWDDTGNVERLEPFQRDKRQ